MAKNEENKITAGDLKTGASFMMPGNVFDNTEGELFAGLNVLRLKQGEAAGPFILKQILANQKLGSAKKMKPVDVYVAETAAKVEIRMPVAASFISKAKDASLSVGDSFAVKRVEDYLAKKFAKNNCAAYELKIISRATKKK